MTAFMDASEAEKIRRLDVLYDGPFGQELERGGCGPTTLVMQGLVPGDFDLTADGHLVPASARGEMIAEAGREIQELTGGEG